MNSCQFEEAEPETQAQQTETKGRGQEARNTGVRTQGKWKHPRTTHPERCFESTVGETSVIGGKCFQHLEVRHQPLLVLHQIEFLRPRSFRREKAGNRLAGFLLFAVLVSSCVNHLLALHPSLTLCRSLSLAVAPSLHRRYSVTIARAMGNSEHAEASTVAVAQPIPTAQLLRARVSLFSSC